jgi:polar amino acid transport system substrate-binding protein
MGASLDTAPDPLANLNKLVLGRLGMIVESEVKLDRMLAKFPERYDDVVNLDQPFKIKPTYLMLSHQFVERHPELAEKLWASIGEIGRSEEIQKRYRHYFTNY